MATQQKTSHNDDVYTTELTRRVKSKKGKAQLTKGNYVMELSRKEIWIVPCSTNLHKQVTQRSRANKEGRELQLSGGQSKN